jgi:hypothetical protein
VGWGPFEPMGPFVDLPDGDLLLPPEDATPGHIGSATGRENDLDSSDQSGALVLLPVNAAASAGGARREAVAFAGPRWN